MEGRVTRRACLDCKAALVDVLDAVLCPNNHPTSAGWYVMVGPRVVGLGHQHFAGYLTGDGATDLTGYRMAGSITRPSLVVDVEGKTWVAFGPVKQRGKTRALLMPSSGDFRPVYVSCSTPVRVLPAGSTRARQFNALLRAALEGAA